MKRIGKSMKISGTHCLAAILASGLTTPCRASNLYVSNIGSNTIEEFTPGGVGSLFGFTGLNRPQGLAFDSAGNLYAANNGADTIEEFTPAGVGSVFASAGLSSPYGLAFDSAGNLYASNNLPNTIEEFTPGGVGSVFASSGLGGPTFLAFDTPEPSTWAMFAIGVVALLLTKRLKILNTR
jgi:DNA-binding beta-propeller fold protein YncE